MSYYSESNRKLFEKYKLGSVDDFEKWQCVHGENNEMSIEDKNQLYEDIIVYLLKYSQHEEKKDNLNNIVGRVYKNLTGG